MSCRGCSFVMFVLDAIVDYIMETHPTIGLVTALYVASNIYCISSLVRREYSLSFSHFCMLWPPCCECAWCKYLKFQQWSHMIKYRNSNIAIIYNNMYTFTCLVIFHSELCSFFLFHLFSSFSFTLFFVPFLFHSHHVVFADDRFSNWNETLLVKD